ncbi:cytoplasmic protein [Tichowtungia aerotolerans]|uniref:Cytoplasmic protein n=1 Tax=Tichowtungia aerotolerans TaxID=2697043 RepID=A0A6P1M377_9BACT|nr:cytoplasmic protein [Tichowtungia aerotolerans]QHI69060.1 cytoplasmic protein [Tichowtungia aerotolerans]
MSDQPEKISDVKMDVANLYREESYTDLKTGGIRKLVPVKLDGSDDDSRPATFSGHTQVMSPHGPIPIQGVIEAATLEEAVNGFPQAMEDAMARMVEEAQKLQREQANKIVTPDDLKKDNGGIII